MTNKLICQENHRFLMKNELFVTDGHLKNHCLVFIIYVMFIKYSVYTWVFLVLERDFKRDNLFEFWMFLKVCFWKQLLGNGIFGAKCKKMRSFLRKKHSFYFCGSRFFSHSGIIPNQAELFRIKLHKKTNTFKWPNIEFLCDFKGFL